MVRGVSKSRFARLMRAAGGSVNSAGVYRLVSFAFLSWLTAYEANKLVATYTTARRTDADHGDGKSYNVDRPDPLARLGQVQDSANDESLKSEVPRERHADSDEKAASANADLSNKNPIKPAGSSTDPHILAGSLPVASAPDKTIPTTSAILKFAISNGDASGGQSQAGFQSEPINTVFAAPSLETAAATVSSVRASGSGIDGSGNGDLNAGHVVTLTVNMSEVVTVAGGMPTLLLNNGGTASYSGGSGTSALTFSYTVAAGQDTADLAVTAFNLNGATVSDGAGNSADLTGAVTNPSGVLQIDTTAPAVPSVVTSGSGIDGSGNGDLNTGRVDARTANT